MTHFCFALKGYGNGVEKPLSAEYLMRVIQHLLTIEGSGEDGTRSSVDMHRNRVAALPEENALPSGAKEADIDMGNVKVENNMENKKMRNSSARHDNEGARTTTRARKITVMWDGDPWRSDSFTAPLPDLFRNLAGNARAQDAAPFSPATTSVSVIANRLQGEGKKFMKEYSRPFLHGNNGRVAGLGVGGGGELGVGRAESKRESHIEIQCCEVKVDEAALLQQKGLGNTTSDPAWQSDYSQLGVRSLQREFEQGKKLIIVAQGGGRVLRDEFRSCLESKLPSSWYIWEYSRGGERPAVLTDQHLRQHFVKLEEAVDLGVKGGRGTSSTRTPISLLELAGSPEQVSIFRAVIK
ncbi:unnamed protein product [Amoebophrya sp. A25]|nr:unnamed protein product [Amoebophrya sp. A25]|eukprot:GSA25T00027397001.1